MRALLFLFLVSVAGAQTTVTGAATGSPGQTGATGPSGISTYTASGTGAVSRTAASKFGDTVNVKDYGAACDGTTNDVAAFAAAFAALPVYGGVVTFDGSCYLEGVGTELILINKPASLVGTGTNAKLRAFGSATTDVIRIAPPANASYVAYHNMLQQIRDFSIESLASSQGSAGTSSRDAITIDTSANDIWFLAITNVRVNTGTNGYAIALRNGSAHGANGGMYLSRIENNQLNGGIFLNNVGDSIYVRNNETTGANAGVYASQVAGAAGLTISGNNITSTGGCIIIDAGARPVISNNECENNVNNTTGSMIELKGSVRTVTAATVELNSINPDTHSQGGVVPIKVEAATGTSLRRNGMSQSGTAFAIVITAAASGTIVQNDNTWSGTAATFLSDSGTATSIAPLTGAALSASSTTAPGWLSWRGDGSLGASTCSGTLAYGEYWYSSFTVAASTTCAITGSNIGSLIIRSTGACTINGTLSAAAYVSSTAGGDWAATGGGGGFGVANGTAGATNTFNVGTIGVGGAAGTAGVSGGVGNGVNTARQAALFSTGFPLIRGAGPGGLGGSAGGTGGNGGGGLILICNSIDYTGGTITAAGGNGVAGGVNTGGGGGGGGGLVILAAKTITVGGGSIVVTGGAGGAIGTGTSTAGGAGGPGWTKSIVIP